MKKASKSVVREFIIASTACAVAYAAINAAVAYVAATDPDPNGAAVLLKTGNPLFDKVWGLVAPGARLGYKIRQDKQADHLTP